MVVVARYYTGLSHGTKAKQQLDARACYILASMVADTSNGEVTRDSPVQRMVASVWYDYASMAHRRYSERNDLCAMYLRGPPNLLVGGSLCIGPTSREGRVAPVLGLLVLLR